MAGEHQGTLLISPSRNTRGIAHSISSDGGRTWSEGGIYFRGSTFSHKRSFLRHFPSGAILMVRSDPPAGDRSRMTTFVSDDDGLTWSDGLQLDERESFYPDGGMGVDRRRGVWHARSRSLQVSLPLVRRHEVPARRTLNRANLDKLQGTWRESNLKSIEEVNEAKRKNAKKPFNLPGIQPTRIGDQRARWIS